MTSIALNGPIRLIMLRSGKYDYAEVELDVPVHLVGPNNVGKTSLIAALQFLYLDEQRQMHFSRNLDETRRYYFPDPNSYILFECRTPSGFQVLGVRGLGPLKGFDFERFAFQGRFEKQDFIGPERRILEPDKIRANLSIKGYTKLEPRHLRAALTGIGDSKGVHLGLVPIRNRDHYSRFRTVFRNLLRLSHLRQDELKALVLDIYRGDFQQIEINLEHQFSNLYRRVKIEAYELQELKALEEHIRLLVEQNIRRQRLKGRLPVLWRAIERELQKKQQDLDAKLRELTARIDALSREREETRKGLRAINQTLKDTTGRLAVLREHLSQLEIDKEGFSDFIPEWAERKQMILQEEVEKIGLRLVGAKMESASQIERRINDLNREIVSLERTLRGLENTLSARMRKNFSEIELDSLFRLLNPELLGLSVGRDEAIVINEPEAAEGQVKDLLLSTDKDLFKGKGFSIRLSSISRPDLERYRDPNVIRSRIDEKKLLLNRDKDLLDASRRAEELKRIQSEKRKELHKLIERLSAYRSFEKRLINAEKWQKEKLELQKKEDELLKKIEELEERLQILVARQQEATSLIEATKKENQKLILRIQELSPPKHDWEPSEDQAEFLEELEDLIRIYKREYQEQERLGSEVARGLQFIEQRTYGRYPASDEAATLSRLLEEVEGLEEKQQAVEKLWTSIAVGLRSSFKGLAKDLDALKGRIGQVNRALKGVSMSNLARLRLVVAERHEWVRRIRELSQGEDLPLFADPKKTREAVEGLGRLLSKYPRVGLSDLFDLHFEVHDTQGEVKTYPHLENIESHGTTITIKVIVNLILLRGLLGREDVRIPYYLDEVSSLDHNNLQAIVDQSRALGFTPVLASPEAMAVAENIYYLTEQQGRVVIEPTTSLLRLERRSLADKDNVSSSAS